MVDPPRSPARLLDELRRRRVPGTAAIYLVAAWGAIEVADTVFPNLGLPPWTVTLVIALAALGLPVVLAMAWYFDLPRADAVAEADDREPDAGETGPPPPRGGPDRRGPNRPVRPRRIGLILAGAALLLASGGVVAMALLGGGGEEGRELDPKTVAIMPFRTAGAGPELQYLREGLMDLLAASLNGREGLPAAVPPRSVTRRLEERPGGGGGDVTEGEALSLARDLGAGRMITGSVVGSGGRASVHATIFDAATGRQLDDLVLPPMHVDSLHAIVDALTTRYVGADAGTLGQDRLAGITTRSVPALRAYLEGQTAFRSGAHEQAVRAFDRAVDLDSTFALAAIGLLRTSGWAIFTESANGDRASRLARSGQEDLPPADRLYLDALQPSWPELPTYPELIRARERAVEQAPDLPELRYLLGDGYFHYGAAAGLADARERGRREFERVVAMDSTYVEPLIHLFHLALGRADTAAVRRYGRLLLAVDATGASETTALVEWAAARLFGGRLPDLDTLSTEAIATITSIGFFSELPTAAVDAIYDRSRSAPTERERDSAALVALMLGYFEGRPSEVWRVLDGPLGDEEWDYDRMAAALFWAPDPLRAEAAARELGAALAGGLAVDAGWRDIARACFLAFWHRDRGAERAADTLLARIDATTRRDDPPDPYAVGTARACTATQRARAAVDANAPDARERVEVLDAVFAEGVRMEPWVREVARTSLANLWQRLGEDERALTAIRNGVMIPDLFILFLDGRPTEGAILERLGRDAEAAEIYAGYLGWRERAEPPFVEEVERVRQRLGGLAGERSRP